jgi:hypothetical protein
MNGRRILKWLTIAAIAASLGATPATNPDTAALTPRQQNLLLQLSDAEANIQAINKALKVTGYSVGVAYDQIDSDLKGNDLMNRQGGGPVRWDEFYGKTAQSFYYHSSASVDIKGRGNLAEAHANYQGKTLTRIDRPEQFKFVYQANNDQIARAKDQIGSLLKNQQALLDRRKTHEEDQSRLWATLAWEQVEDREIALHPLSRFALKPSGPEAAVLRPLVLFLRTADRVAADGLDSIQADQAATFQADSQRMAAAFAVLQLALADPLDDPALPAERRKDAEAIKALCKEVSEECKVIADNYANALDRDKANQDASKLEFRGQLQTSLGEFASAVRVLDDGIVATAKAWGIEPDRTTPASDSVPPQVLHASAGSGPMRVVPPESTAGSNAALQPAPSQGASPVAKDEAGGNTWSIAPGKWSRRWTTRGGDLKPDMRTQTYEVFEGGARVKAYSWNLPFVREADGSLSIESHFFQVFSKEKDGISVRQWKNRADYTAGKEAVYIGVFEPVDAGKASDGSPAAPAQTPPNVGAREMPAGAAKYQNHFFAVIEGSYTWMEAEAKCEAMGGHLAKIEDSDCVKFLHKLKPKELWVGAADLKHVRQYVWLDGTPVDPRLWRRGEPGYWKEDTVVLLSGGDGLNDVVKDSKRGCICAWD